MNITENARIRELLEQKAAGKQVSLTEWARAIAAWSTEGWTEKKWDAFAKHGIRELNLVETTFGMQELRLPVRETFEEFRWQLILAYAESRQLGLEDYLRLVDWHCFLAAEKELVCEYQQRKDAVIETYLYVVRVPAPRHIAPDGYMWLVREEDERNEIDHWIPTPYATREEAEAAARARAAELDTKPKKEYVSDVVNDPRIQRLLSRRDAGEDVDSTEWIRAIAAWFTFSWDEKRWQEFVCRGLTWAQVDELIAAANWLKLVPRVVVEGVHRAILFGYAESKHQELVELLRAGPSAWGNKYVRREQ